ncbi:MAG: 50S ribosomal protein L25/general stress protein Ctc [Gammaproteobacteria bacterium]|nr:50S ribosomal protein L25/general stress protein Ctc [Gammaproteobacteria bacterium]
MSSMIELIADGREDAGKGASRRLRRQGKVPAVLYGGGRPPRSLTLDHQSILHQMENEAFYSSVLSIRLGDKTQSVVIRDVQRHPARRAVLHLDFQRIQADEALRMIVPIHFPGEDVAKGVKLGGGMLSRMTNEVEIECLPKDLPEYLELDVTELDMDEILHLSDIKLPTGVEIPALAQGEQYNQPVVAIHRPRAEEPEEEPEALEGEVPEADAAPEAGGEEPSGD